MAGPGSQRNKASEEHAAWPASQGAAWHFLAAAGNDSTCMHVLLPPEHPQQPSLLLLFTQRCRSRCRNQSCCRGDCSTPIALACPTQPHKAGRRAGLSAREKHKNSKGGCRVGWGSTPPVEKHLPSAFRCLGWLLMCALPCLACTCRTAGPRMAYTFHSLPDHPDANILPLRSSCRCR